MKYKKDFPNPVIEALRADIRRRGLPRVAYDMNCCESYIERMAYGIRPLTRFVADKLGFEMVVTWRKKP